MTHHAIILIVSHDHIYTGIEVRDIECRLTGRLQHTHAVHRRNHETGIIALYMHNRPSRIGINRKITCGLYRFDSRFTTELDGYQLRFTRIVHGFDTGLVLTFRKILEQIAVGRGRSHLRSVEINLMRGRLPI